MFSLTNKFNQGMAKVFDWMGLNVIFLLLCLPVVTIGANLTALYSVTMKMADKEDYYPFKLFFQELSRNWKQATVIWMMLLTLAGVLYFDYRLVVENNIFQTVLIPLLYFFAGLGIIYLLYVFPILAKFPNPIKVTLKNTFLIAIGFLPYSILLLLIVVGPALAMIYWLPHYTPYLLYFYLVIGVSFTAYLQSFFLNRIFRKVIQTAQTERG